MQATRGIDVGRITSLGECAFYAHTAPEHVVARIGDADIVLNTPSPITRRVFEKCRNLKYIGVTSTGYNMIDIEAANEYGVVVSNVPNYAAYTVSQFAIGLLMEICLNIGRQTDAVRAGDWLGIKNSGSSWEPTRMEFRDKTMGIIGCGAIGRQTAVIAMALGMRILACDQIKRAEWENSEFHYTSLETLLSESDIVSLHCPVTDKTRHIINMTSISKMKKSAILINTSRGHLINERDLASALNNGGLAAAGLDVLTDEPPMDDNPLLSAKNCYITPHVAWATPEAQVKLFDSIVENLLAFLAGKPRNVIKN